MTRYHPVYLQSRERAKRDNNCGAGSRPRRVYTPVEWLKYFEKREQIVVENGNSFCVYSSGSKGVVCVLLHGGGYSGLTWALLAKRLTSDVECRCIAIDFRGHGLTTTYDDHNLSANTLSEDVVTVLNKIYGDALPPIVLIGHSMGGAIAVHIAAKQLISTLVALSVIDVVEGTALDALTCMQSYLRGRPQRFKTIEHAIQWSISTGQTRNIESARVSMPGQIKLLKDSESAPLDNVNEGNISDCIQENEDNENEIISNKLKYGWRIDLSKTDHYWKGWFEGLSKMFLSCTAPKLLLLAGIDRLDKELIVGQMQGKFQMQVLPQCGHAVHEDIPDRVADVISSFLLRHKLLVKLSSQQ